MTSPSGSSKVSAAHSTSSSIVAAGAMWRVSTAKSTYKTEGTDLGRKGRRGLRETKGDDQRLVLATLRLRISATTKAGRTPTSPPVALR